VAIVLAMAATAAAGVLAGSRGYAFSTPSPGPTSEPTVTASPAPTPDSVVECESEDVAEFEACLQAAWGEGPATCPVPTAEPTPTTAGDMAVLAAADPPCTIKAKQIVAVSELFEAPKAPKVGDTLELELNISLPSGAKNAADAAIKMVTDKGKTVIGVKIRSKVFQIDDNGGAIVVYAQANCIEVSAKGNYGLVQGFVNGPKFAVPVQVK